MTEPEASGQQPSRMETILAEYLAAQDAGRAPSRSELLTRYPDEADELRAFFADHDRIDPLAAPFRPPARTTEAAAGANPADMPTLAPGSTSAASVGDTIRYFGDYELLEEIARGGMGVVFKGRQRSLNRNVALKMIKAGEFATEADVQRFHTEAEAAANLDHPNIVPIYEVGEFQGQQYFSMAYIEGGSLADRLASGPLAPIEAAELVRTLALAMQHAHDRGVVHRDLKPANVLLQKVDSRQQTVDSTNAISRDSSSASSDSQRPATGYLPKIADFGLAKRSHTTDGPTLSGQIVGTPGYMAPEQAAGTVNLVGPLADVYGLGAILYACLTGRPPFQAGTPLDTVLQVLEQEPVRPSKINPRVPRDLQTICLKCLEKSVTRRYESAREVALDLERFLNREPVQARPAGWSRRAWTWSQKRPWALTTSAAVLLLVAFVWIYLQTTRLRDAQWHELFLQAKVARLTHQPKQARELLREVARETPERSLVEEGLRVLQSEGTGLRTISLNEQASKALDQIDKGRNMWSLPTFNPSRDGNRLLVGNMNEAIVLDLKKGTLLQQLDQIDFVLMNDQGSLLITCRRDDHRRLLRVHDLNANQEKGVIRLDGALQRMTFHPDGRQLAIAMSSSSEMAGPRGGLSIWDVLNLKPLIAFPDSDATTPVYSMAFTADATRLVMTHIVRADEKEVSLDGQTNIVPQFVSAQVNVWDTRSRQKLASWPLPREPKSVAIDPGSRQLACLFNEPVAIEIVELDSGARVAQLSPRPPTPAPASRRQLQPKFQNFEGPLRYTSDGKFLVSRLLGSRTVPIPSAAMTWAWSIAMDFPVTVVWELSTRSEWLRLPNSEGEPVADAPETLVLLSPTEGDAQPRTRLSVCHLVETSRELEAMGLSTCPWVPDAAASEMSPFPYPLSLYCANVEIFWLSCACLFVVPYACCLILQWRIKRGRPVSSNFLTVCGLLAVLTSAWGLYNLCTFLNTPGWNFGLNVILGSISATPAIGGISLIFFTLTAYGTSVYGRSRQAEAAESGHGFKGWLRRNYGKQAVGGLLGSIGGMALAGVILIVTDNQSIIWAALLMFGVAPFSVAFGFLYLWYRFDERRRKPVR